MRLGRMLCSCSSALYEMGLFPRFWVIVIPVTFQLWVTFPHNPLGVVLSSGLVVKVDFFLIPL